MFASIIYNVSLLILEVLNQSRNPMKLLCTYLIILRYHCAENTLCVVQL